MCGFSSYVRGMHCPEPTQARLIADAALAVLGALGGGAMVGSWLMGCVRLLVQRRRRGLGDEMSVGFVWGVIVALTFAPYVFTFYLP
jgi:hypothetical protein